MSSPVQSTFILGTLLYANTYNNSQHGYVVVKVMVDLAIQIIHDVSCVANLVIWCLNAGMDLIIPLLDLTLLQALIILLLT